MQDSEISDKNYVMIIWCCW